MFGNAAAPSRVYAYGACAPCQGVSLVNEQMRAAHRYYNSLVEAELARRQAVEACLQRLCPEVTRLAEEAAQLEESLERTRAQLRARNAQQRRRAQTTEQRSSIRDLLGQLRSCRAALKAARQEGFARDEVKLALADIDAADLARRKQLRRQSGLYWGTYSIIEQSLMGARRGVPPRYHRWTGEGRIAVQTQKGLPVQELLAGEDSRLRLIVTDTSHSEPRAQLWLRVGSDKGRQPIWAVFPIVYHRPLPEDALIKWCYVVRRRIASHDEWQVQLVLARDSWDRADVASENTAAIDLGWRMLGDGTMRVACWVGSDGRQGQLTISRYDLRRWHKADELRSIRDRCLTAAIATLADGLAKLSTMPAWLAERTAYLRQWRSAARLAALAIQWRTSRFPGDEQVYEALETWRKQDKHLWEWEAHQRTRAVRWRDDLYRNFAAQMRRAYHTLIVEDANWQQVQRLPEVEEDEGGITSTYHRIAAVGRLRQLIEDSAAHSVRAPAVDTTRRCHHCGTINDWDQAAELVHTCDSCGVIWDQDVNAAWNLLLGTTVGSTESTDS